jgi:hypothetical protein
MAGPSVAESEIMKECGGKALQCLAALEQEGFVKKTNGIYCIKDET